MRRRRLKEFFKAHFFPEGFSARQVFTNRLNYYLSAFFFNIFPLPQREAGARQTLRYIGEVAGDGYSVLIFPEGVRSAERGHQTVQARHWDDWLTAQFARHSGADRRRRSGAAHQLEVAEAGPGFGDLRAANAFIW